MKRVLVLSFSDDKNKNILLDLINDSEKADAACVFVSHNIFLRAIRRWSLLYRLPGVGCWMGAWKHQIKEYDVVICIASSYSSAVLEWIHKKNPNAKLVNYYWDKISVANYPIIDSMAYENWSFDKKDCEKYGFQYNAQFFVNDLKLEKAKLTYDISFVGADREGKWQDRITFVDNCYDLFQQYGFCTYFYFVSKNPPFQRDYIYDKRLTEEEFYQVTAQSKVVLEIVQPEEEWLTLRPLLALSNMKKLITNNKWIKEERFYSKENVFILGEDENDRLFHFVNTPFVEIKEEDLKYYELEAWLERFCR